MCRVDTSCFFFDERFASFGDPFMVAMGSLLHLEMRFEGLSSYQQDYVKHPTRPRSVAFV